MRTGVIFLLLAVSMVGCSVPDPQYRVDPTPIKSTYPPPAPGYQRRTLGILKFKDKTGKGYLANPATDELTTLLSRTQRFRIIEQERWQEIMQEQKHWQGNPRNPGQPLQTAGVDLIFTGAVTNFEVRRTRTRAGVVLGLAGGGKKEVYRVDVGIDGRLLDTRTGTVIWSDFVETHREDVARGLHILLTGYDQQVNVLESNAGKQLRYALDKLVRKMIKALDEQNLPGGEQPLPQQPGRSQ